MITCPEDGNPAKIPLMVKGVRNLTVYLGGSGAVRKIRACKPQAPAHRGSEVILATVVGNK